MSTLSEAFAYEDTHPSAVCNQESRVPGKPLLSVSLSLTQQTLSSIPVLSAPDH